MSSENKQHAGEPQDMAALRQRVAELEQANAVLQQQVAHLEHERDTAQESYQQMHTVLMQAPAAIFLLRGKDHIYEMANPPYLAMINKGDVLGKPVREVFPELEGQGYFEVLDQVFASGETLIQQEFPAQIDRRGDGTLEQGWFNLVYQPIRNAEGAVDGILHLVFEVTDQVRSRLAVEAQNTEIERLSAERDRFFTMLPDMACVMDFTGKFQRLNPSWERTLGFTLDELLAGEVSDFIHPDDLAATTAMAEKMVASGGELTSYTNRFRRKDGSYIWLEWTAVSELEDQMTYAVARDISERIEQEGQLSIFKTVVENAPDGVSLVSPDGIITYANSSMRAMLRYDDDYVGLPVAAVFGGDADTPAEIIQHVLEHDIWQGNQTYYRKDGSLVQIHLSVFPIRNAEGSVLTFPGIVRDLTDVHQAEEERAALQQQVIDAQRDALRELGTPLIPISDDVVIMPLIGTIDSTRAQQVLEALLTGVAHYQAELAILDITGVTIVDTQVAQALVQAARSVNLLGAKVMLTGIQPQIAQTLVMLGVDLQTILTRGTLQAGIAEALR